MTVWGADVAGLQAIAVDLERYAGSVEQARQNVDAQLARTAWEGPTADAFRSRWRTMALRDLGGFHQELTAAAADLRRQAQEQLDASSVRGGGAASGLAGVAPGAASGIAGLAALGRQGLASPVARSLLAPALLPHILPALALPAAAQVGRELFFPDAMTSAKTVSEVAIATLRSNVLPTMLVTSGGQEALRSHWLFMDAGRDHALHTAGTALAVGAAGIKGAYTQWNADRGDGYAGLERGARAGAVGAVYGGAVLSAKMAVTAGSTLVLGTAAAPAVATVAVGMVATAGVTWALGTEPGQQFTGAVADGVSQGFDYGRQGIEELGVLRDAATDWAADRLDDAAGLVDEAGELVTSAGEALDSLGGSVQDAVSSTVDRFNPFAR